MVATALLSGMAIGDESGSGLILGVHVTAVVLIGVGLLVALVVGDHRGIVRAAGQLFGFDRRDVSWLRSRLRHPFRRHTDPAWGMFNTGQKVLAWFLSLSMVAVILTGVQAWSASEEEGSLHGAAVVLTTLLLGAHIFMAVVNPATRPALAGMVFGRVRRSWAAEHHSEWLARISHHPAG
jgi:formate dehydrogenase subunit gamma